MAWFKVDDQLATHPKVLGAGLRAMGLWTLAGAWSAQHLTDGHIPATVITTLGARRSDAEALVKVGMWDHTDGGYRFHDWLDYQPTREAVQDRRAKTAERVKEWRRKKAEDAE